MLTFDGPNKLVILSGVTTLSVRDLWSRWVDWALTSDNSKFPVAMEQVGGQEIDAGAGTRIPIYCFLLNGWKVRPQESSHTLTVGDGVLLVSGGGDPFVNTVGTFVVRVNYQQPVQAISFSSTGATAPDPLESVVEGTLTLGGAIRLLLATNSGISDGAGTSTRTFRDRANTKARVTGTVDAAGNRTAVVLDPD